MSFRHAAAAAFCLAVSALAGVAAHAAGVPLAFVIAPMVTTAAFAISGLPVWAPVRGRRAGQLVVGAALGVNLSWPVVAGAAPWFPLMAGAALVSVGLSALLGLGFARAARLDMRTAFFATLPGGVAEMANVGASLGARVEPVALFHAMRVALAVMILPPFILWLGIDGGIESVLAEERIPLAAVPLVLLGGGAGSVIAMRLGLNNPWMMGSLAATAVLASTGLVTGRLPDPLFWAGQFLLGIAIGGRFRRDIVLRLGRVAAAALATIVAMLVLSALFGLLLAAVMGVDVGTGILVVAPGGLAEMAVTAKILHLDIALIVLFHVVRVFMVTAFATHYYFAFERMGLFAAGERLFRSRT